MTAQFATLSEDTEAVRWGGTFHSRTKDVRLFRKGQRVRVLRICPDRSLEVTDALDGGLGGFRAKVAWELLDDFSGRVKWADLTDKKGLP
jgi:hypothetical protein